MVEHCERQKQQPTLVVDALYIRLPGCESNVFSWDFFDQKRCTEYRYHHHLRHLGSPEGTYKLLT